MTSEAELVLNCKNCPHTVIPISGVVNGWTHGGTPESWHGVRCARSLTGAEPDIATVVAERDELRAIATKLAADLVGVMEDENGECMACGGSGSIDPTDHFEGCWVMDKHLIPLAASLSPTPLTDKEA